MPQCSPTQHNNNNKKKKWKWKKHIGKNSWEGKNEISLGKKLESLYHFPVMLPSQWNP
jgi:hypothetical protein